MRGHKRLAVAALAAGIVAVTVAGCGSGDSISDGVGSVADALGVESPESAEARALCADARLDSNLSVEEFVEATKQPWIVDGVPLSATDDPLVPSRADTAREFAEFIEATPDGGQGRFARAACLAYRDKGYIPRNHDGTYVEMPLSAVLDLGYAACKMGKTLLEQQGGLTLPAEMVPPSATPGSGTAAGNIISEATSKHLCPQV
ncbi:hypothetical protein LCL87_17035 [Rhodococcus hoagii]|nr:hypothetical protein [Prescottella equi]